MNQREKTKFKNTCAATNKRCPQPSSPASTRFGPTARTLHVAQREVSGLRKEHVRHTGQAPVAPPVYRPQPLPKVLQTRTGPVTGKSLVESDHTTLLPLALRSQRSSGGSRTKLAIAKPAARRGIALTMPAPAFKTDQSPPRTVQRFTSRVVQAVKFYPNLHPGAVEPVDPSNIFKLDSFANQYRLHKIHSHGVNVPNQQYNFVRTREGEMLLHSRYRHPSIAEGKQVLYAGEIFFNNGKLQWWSNGSGHYQPYVEDAEQANLPMDQFFSYQQIIKGEHTRKKG
jgi:hypothetical protein